MLDWCTVQGIEKQVRGRLYQCWGRLCYDTSLVRRGYRMQLLGKTQQVFHVPERRAAARLKLWDRMLCRLE